MTQQCWEAKNCGREPGGAKVVELGTCPAATDKSFHGTNHGVNGGRYCWKIAGTLCGGKVQGTEAQKTRSCSKCEFFKTVIKEEGVGFVS